MSEIIINGIKGAYLQPAVYGVNEAGAYIVLEYHGTRNEIAAIADSILLNGGTFEITESYSGAADRLVARFPTNGPEQPIDDWEVVAALVEKDVLESNLEVVKALSEREKKLIRKYVEDPSLESSPALDPTSDAYKLYLEMLGGLRSAEVSVPTLRWTRTVSKTFNLGALRDMNTVFRTATLLADRTLNITAQAAGKMPDDTDPIFADGTQKHYGWKKTSESIRVALNQKTQQVMEWQYGLWSRLVYGVPS